MTERAPMLSDNLLDGIDWNEVQRTKAEVSEIQHGSDGISIVDLTFEGRPYRIRLDTGHLDLPEAEIACQNVPEWWNESIGPGVVFDETLSTD